MLQFVLCFFKILLQNKATVSAPCEPCIPCWLVSIASVMLVCIVTRRIKWMDGWTFIATWFIACIAFNCSLCRAETLFVIIQTRVASTPLSNATVFNKLTCSNLGNAQNLRMLIGTSRQGHAGTITPSRESPKWISMLCIIGVRIS